MNSRNSFEPLRVTATLRTGVISDEYLPLDGILFYQVMRERYGPRDYSLPGGSEGHVALDSVRLPLAVHHGARTDWYYRCSFAQPQPWWLAEGQDHWNKRFDQGYADLIDFQGRRGRVIIEQNRYRAYHMPVFYRVAERIEWYGVGDGDRIAELLGTVMHIGKKGVQGWGRVIGWQVEPWPEDWSCWRDGQPTRALPAEEPLDLARRYRHYGLRPSYYDHKNQRLVMVP